MERCVTGTGCTLKGLYKFLSFFNETNTDDIYLEIKSIQRISTATLNSSLRVFLVTG